MFLFIGVLFQDSLYGSAWDAKAYSLSHSLTVDDVTAHGRRVMFLIIGMSAQDSLYGSAWVAKAYSLSPTVTVDDVVTYGRCMIYLIIGMLFQDSLYFRTAYSRLTAKPSTSCLPMVDARRIHRHVYP